jgi:gliding motility-associated lipoprotein GldH
MIRTVLILFGISILLLISCDPNRQYEAFKNFDGNWYVDSVAVFEFEIEDSTKNYDLIAHFRNRFSYPFHNLYFRFEMESENGRLVEEDLKEIYFFEPKSGKPYGSGLGDQFNHEYVLLDDYQFDSAMNYRVKLVQFMRMDTLPDIERVGLRLEVDNQD